LALLVCLHFFFFFTPLLTTKFRSALFVITLLIRCANQYPDDIDPSSPEGDASDLIALIPFLESVAFYKPSDVRPILKAYRKEGERVARGK
jgi:hypothetical protein